MPADKPSRKATTRKRRLAETIKALTALQFGPKQRNETAACTLLALLDLQPDVPWAEAQAPLCGITPTIDFIATAYGELLRVRHFAARRATLISRLLTIVRKYANMSEGDAGKYAGHGICFL